MCTEDNPSDVFDHEDMIIHIGISEGSEKTTCPRCRRELFDQDSVVDCAYEDCPNLDMYSDLLGLD